MKSDDKYFFFTNQLLETIKAQAVGAWEITKEDYEDAFSNYRVS